MTYFLIHDTCVMTPEGPIERGWILIRNRQISHIGLPHDTPNTAGETLALINGKGKTALPGFIDLHVHGAVGQDTMDATEDALYKMARFYATRGVTSFLPTTMTADDASTRHALRVIASCRGPISDGAAILGAHLEGPYINAAMKGAQAGEHIRRADPEKYREWLDLNVIKQVTVAPEFNENQRFIMECVQRGINVSIGHTQAGYEDVKIAIQLGARQATHTFNAMTGLHHRNPGTVGAVLTEDKMICELIADNIHVHPAVMKLMVRAKGIAGIILITDAIMGAGMPDGQYQLGGQPVKVEGGMATLEDGTLAGSILTMDRALKNLMRATGLTLEEAWPMTSANAAKQIGLGDKKGKLVPGYDADIVLLDDTGNVALTMAEGQITYRAKR